MVKYKMATIFKADFCWALTSYKADSFQGIFSGEDHVMRVLAEAKKQKMFIKSSLLVTQKARKAGNKSGKNRNKKPAAGGTKAKGKGKGAKKKAGAKPKAKAASDNNRDKEASSAKGKDKDEPCKFILNNLASCHPSISESCKFGTNMDDTVASIPWSSDWPVSFLLQSATDYVLALGLDPETIVSTLSNKLGGRIVYSYRKNGTYE